MLQQPQWDPAEPLGRIQLVLTEGVLKEVRAAEVVGPKVTFEGVREVVAFAFQHAPQGNRCNTMGLGISLTHFHRRT